jgi:hypothetical protein
VTIKRPVQVVQVSGSYKVPFHIKDADGALLAHVTGDQLSPEGTSIGKARAIAQEIAEALNAHPAATPGEQKPEEHSATPRTDALLLAAEEQKPSDFWKANAFVDLARQLERDRARLVEALRLIRDCTYVDAEGPELRAQNEINHRRASDILRELGEL